MTHENEIEKTFIEILTMRANQWTYRSDLKSEAALWANLRGHINRINVAGLDGEPLTDVEFKQIKTDQFITVIQRTANWESLKLCRPASSLLRAARQ